MQSEIKTITHPNGEIQRFQIVRWDSWGQLDFLAPVHSPKTLDCFADNYRNYLVPAAPWLFGQMVMFRLPNDFSPEHSFCFQKYGSVASPLTAAAAVFRDGITIYRGKPVFHNDDSRKLWYALEKQDCIRMINGKLPFTKIIPVANTPGYLTKTTPDAALKVNASFFIMDSFDCATVYDHIGMPFGLCVKNGNVICPPLYNREAFLVHQNGEIRIRHMDITDLEIEISGHCFRHGKNAFIYERPKNRRSPSHWKKSLIITGCTVAAVKEGAACIPASGFVLCPQEDVDIAAGATVVYHGLEHVHFGIQVGNSILKNGIKTDVFHSRFYNIRHLEPIPFPPSLYPMDFNCDRAARIALGESSEGKPMLLWAEGAPKFGYHPGQSSCGASLQEMAEICAQAGMKNAVNLDGGGSAQILLHNKRTLQMSDRDAKSFAEVERPVPLGLMVN